MIENHVHATQEADVDAVCGVIGSIALVAGVLLLFYLLRTTSRNEGEQHGGGFEGADSAFGYPPLEDKPKIPPNDPHQNPS